MIETTGELYQSSKYAKALCVSGSKVGKSCFLVASALGVFPSQKFGGIIDKPANLHVITFDANALGGIQNFLTKTCNAPKEALGFRVYNLQDSFRRVSDSDSEYDMTFFNDVFVALDKIKTHAAKGGVHAVLFSSLTGLAAGLERAVIGPPGNKKGNGADPSKWQAFSHQLTEIQNFSQVDSWHCLWEAHLDKAPALDMGSGAPQAKETIRVSGKAGRSWAYNVEQVFQIRRNMGQKHPNTNCDVVYLDTRPSLDFISNGRGFTENLAPQEPDLTVAFKKLGLTVGRWNSPSK